MRAMARATPMTMISPMLFRGRIIFRKAWEGRNSTIRRSAASNGIFASAWNIGHGYGRSVRGAGEDRFQRNRLIHLKMNYPHSYPHLSTARAASALDAALVCFSQGFESAGRGQPLVRKVFLIFTLYQSLQRDEVFHDARFVSRRARDPWRLRDRPTAGQQCMRGLRSTRRLVQ